MILCVPPRRATVTDREHGKAGPDKEGGIRISHHIVALGLVVALSLGLIAIGALPARAESPVRGGTFIFAISNGEPDTYDCQASPSGAVLQRVAPHYSTLLKIDQANYPNIVGDLAENWTMSPDGLTFTFRLHPNVKFHDGTTLTAADVKATFERIINPPPGVISVRRNYYTDVAAIDTPDDRTIVFRLAKPNAAMLTFLASPWACIYSARLLASDRDYPTRRVMGTGPFRFVEHMVGSEWHGERFDGYFREGLPYLDGFRAVNITGTALINALSVGQVQTDFRGVDPAQRDRIVAERGNQVRALESDQPGLLLVTFNSEHPPFNDVRVRQALNLAIDRWAGSVPMSKLTFFNSVGGLQRPGSTFARSKSELEQLPGFRPDMNANRAEARRLLAEAGQSDLKVTLASRPVYSNLGIFLIDQWRQIGVTATQEMMENQRFFPSLSGGNFDIIISAVQDYVDEPAMQLAIAPSYKTPNPANSARTNDAGIDALYDAQLRALDLGQRKQIVHDLEAKLMDQAAMVPLFWARRYQTISSDVQGYTMTPSALVGQDLSQIWLTPK